MGYVGVAHQCNGVRGMDGFTCADLVLLQLFTKDLVCNILI